MNIGWQEIMLVMVFALIVFGPKRLPEIGRQVGKAIREVRKVSREFEREVREVTEPLDREIRELGDAPPVTPKHPIDEHGSSYLTKPTPDGSTNAPDGSTTD